MQPEKRNALFKLEKELYIFSGLGADERVFQKLEFKDYKTTFIKWIPPFDSENIEQYAKRLIAQIPSKKPTLLGLSFGGLIAIEVAKQIEIEKIILIASAKTKNEIPIYYRLAGKLKLHKILPTKLLKKANFISYWIFGIKSNFDKQLLKQILLDTDKDFLKWAIDKVVNWENETILEQIFHIHGTADRILPYCFVSSDLSVKNGGHFMTLNKSDELNKILNAHL